LDEWIYFLKNSEVRDDFKAKGLKEASDALDIMRLPAGDKYNYNRYLEYLSYKASEMFSLKMAAEERVEERTKIDIAKNAILDGIDDQVISKITRLPIERIIEIRKSIEGK
jgi:hypothetical protein